MTTAHIKEEAIIAEGTIHVKIKGREDLGIFILGNATEFATSFTAEVKERISKMRSTYGQVLNTVTIPKPGELSMKIDTLNKETLAMGMMGVLSKEALAVKTVPNHALTDFKGDIWIKLPDRYIDGAVTVKSSDGTKTVDAAEVEVEPRLGLVKISETGAAAATINAGDGFTVSYTTASWERWQIAAFKETELRGEMWLDGKNRVTGEDVMLHIPQFTLTVDGSFNFFTEDFNEITFKGRTEIADGQDAPYYVELKENA